MVTNRFLLYGTWTSAATLLATTLAVIVLLTHAGLDLDYRVIIGPFLAIVMLICVVCVFLTFLPPAAYLGWVERRYEHAVASAA